MNCRVHRADDSGAFLFDVYCPMDYPNAPPKVMITTTGGGSVRFNPNVRPELGKPPPCLPLPMLTCAVCRVTCGRCVVVPTLNSLNSCALVQLYANGKVCVR